MTRKKSIWTRVLALCLMIPATMAIASCKGKTHEHTFSDEWAKTATEHYHAATCEHTSEKKDAAPHTFGEWIIKTPAGVHQDRVEERECSICEYKEERTVSGTQTHSYSDTWEHDDTNHWHECECGDKSELEAHTYGAWSEKTAAGVDQNKQYSRKCTICGQEDILTFDNTNTNGAYCVVITNVFVINGVKHLDVNVIRGTIFAGDNLIFDGVDAEVSIDKIINSDRKELSSASSGDSVFLQISVDKGDVDQINNRTVGGRLAYEPNTTKSYKTFNAQITIVESKFSGKIYNGRTLKLDLYNSGYGLIDSILALPEGVEIAKDGESYIVTITIPDNDVSRVLWAGMEFTYKLYDSTSSSNVIVANGIILSVVA